jgi:hypothetical protein
MDGRSMFPWVFAAFNRDPSTMSFDKLFCNEQSNARPNRCPSRKERIEHRRQSFWTDPLAVIPDAEENTSRLCLTVSYVDVDNPSARKGVDGIGKVRFRGSNRESASQCPLDP